MSSASPHDSGPATEGDVASTEDNKTLQNLHSGRVRLAEAAQKKRKNRKGANGSSKKRGTGFEEYYCDPPVTPAEYDEEKNVLYPLHRPFVERIEECIQRFRARRRMNSEQNYLFSRYLLLGGVDANARQFQGTSKLGNEDLEGRTKAEVRDISADDVIQRGAKTDSRFYNPSYPEHWVVDFTGVVAGFLSEELVSHYGVDMAVYRVGVEVVSNFLKYVDKHDVCPEYVEDVRKAQQLCEQTLQQMPDIAELLVALPGTFNKAACTLFCSKDNRGYCEFDSNIASPDETLDENTTRTIFGANMALLLQRDYGRYIAETMAKKELVVTETVEETFEVVRISLPTDEVRAKYKKINDHLGKNFQLEPCGSLILRHTVIRNGWDNPSEDITPSEPSKGAEIFFLEEHLLKLLQVEMKLSVVVCTLSAGFRFIKDVKGVYPTFYTFLPQQLMLHYKEPVKDNRPAPRVQGSGTDEDILSQIPTGDPED